MRAEDAPPAGWYPDPEGYTRLRWWEGTDWSDQYRAPPTPSESDLKEQAYGYVDDPADARVPTYQQSAGGALSRQDTDVIITQVRLAAREEVERAAALFGQQARYATQSLTPLITQYTSKITRWFRILSVIAIVLLIAWLAFQLFAQVSLFQWIGDRIDNVSNNGSLVGAAPLG